MLDFSRAAITKPKPPKGESAPHRATSDLLADIVDRALVQKRQSDTPRDYLGGSRLGHPKSEVRAERGCERALFYEYHHAAKDPGRDFPAKLYRVFDMGHDGEERVAEYLKLAGFKLFTEKANGQQFGFGVLPDPETGKPRIAGHIDGVITEGPDKLKVQYPLLWENKGMNNKKFTQCDDKGVALSHPIYYGQMQVYMGVMELKASLFTAMNRDTGEVTYQLIEYNEAHAQAALDRGVRVIAAKTPLQCERIQNDYEAIPCKWCDYRLTCEADEAARGPGDKTTTATPEWL